MLESLESETPNIKDLTLEDETKTLRSEFSLESEITDDDWQKMRQTLKEARTADQNTDSWKNFGDLAMRMCQLFPNKKANFDLDQEYYQKLKTYFNQEKEIGSWKYAANSASVIQALYPDKMAEIELDETFRLGLLSEVARYRKSDYYQQDFQDHAVTYKKLFRDDSELGLTDEIFQKLIERINKYVREEMGWHEMIISLSEIKMLYPNKFDEIGITPNDIQGMKRFIAEKKAEGNWDRFITMASLFKILAAQRINFTDHGIVLEMDNGFQDTPPPPLPNQRSF